jgi:hypothetical protein
MVQASTIFAHLLDEFDDSGDSIPNPTYLYRLQKLGLDSIPKAELRDVGTPYVWVQNLAGLVFPKFDGAVDDDEPENLGVQVDEKICQSKVSFTAKRAILHETAKFGMT